MLRSLDSMAVAGHNEPTRPGASPATARQLDPRQNPHDVSAGIHSPLGNAAATPDGLRDARETNLSARPTANNNVAARGNSERNSHPSPLERLTNTAAAAPKLPLCSFGPGGGYVIDWQVQTQDLVEPRRVFPPKTLGAAVRRVTGWLLWDLKGWLIATHPGRRFRADTHPRATDPCGLCGHSALWPHWFANGQAEPPRFAVLGLDPVQAELAAEPNEQAVATVLAGGGDHAAARRGDDVDTRPLDTARTQAAADAAAANEQNIAQEIAQENLAAAEDVEGPYLFPFHCAGSNELEPVGSFNQSPAGRLIAKLAADARPSQSSHAGAANGAAAAVGGEGAAGAAQMEQSHDTHTQTTQNPDRRAGLPGSQRLLADHAGTGGSARRVKGHHLRARRGTGKEGAHSPCPEQGSLFGGCADGAAA